MPVPGLTGHPRQPDRTATVRAVDSIFPKGIESAAPRNVKFEKTLDLVHRRQPSAPRGYFRVSLGGGQERSICAFCFFVALQFVQLQLQ